MREAIKKAGIEPDEAEIKKLADNDVALEGTKAQQLLKLIEALDDQDDVSNVWDNSDISEAEMEAAPPASMIVLGVDPGSQRTGYGAVESDGRRHRLLEAGVLAPGARLSPRRETPPHPRGRRAA